MAEATRAHIIYKSKKVLKAYVNKIKNAKNYYEYLPEEGKQVVTDYVNNEQNIEVFLQYAIYYDDFIEELSDKNLLELASICYTLNKGLNLGINYKDKITKINNKEKTLVYERLEEIKMLLNTKSFTNKNEEEILHLLETFSDDELYIIQKDLYDLQKKIYRKLIFSQDKAARQFYNTHRKGLFVTKDETGKIIKLNYTPGNDVVVVNRKGELLEYFQYETGSRAEFFGNALGIGKNRADWMMQVLDMILMTKWV